MEQANSIESYNEVLKRYLGIVDNIRFLIRNDKISDMVKQSMIRKDLNKVSSEIEKINQEFSQWKTRLGIAE